MHYFYMFASMALFCIKSNALVNIIAWPESPPPVEQTARMARYIVHTSDWCTISTVNSYNSSTMYPKARVYSFADGIDIFSTGIPYIYASLRDPEIQTLVINNRSSVSVSLAQSDYCRQHNYDPEDPRCGQVILTGQFSFVENGTQEYTTARNSLFIRHPAMVYWPKSHHWKIGKLNIQEVQVVDNFGGSKYPSINEYFQATPY
uniref:CREG-like beta-barrel domain-containing protein n=1 Tax=Clastoptera arizonana TaxID=38151 RepID=A0A1B6EAA0_9HEMI